MRKVAFVMPSLLPMPPVRGGAVETLVDGLLRENAKAGGMEIAVYCLYDAEAEARYAAYPHVRFVPIRTYAAQEKLQRFVRRAVRKALRFVIVPERAYLGRVLKRMRGERYDAVIVENQPAFVPALHRLGAGPVLLHMHNILYAAEIRHSERIGAMCSRVLCVSGFIRDWLCGHAGMRPEQCEILLNCVDLDRFAGATQAARAEVRARFGIPEEAPVFVYAGRITPEKGIRELAQAFALADVPDAQLLFVGSQWFGATVEDDYLREVRALLTPLAGRVHFTGFVPYDQMPAHYAAGDVAVLPSLWDEPGALTLLEAQAAGLPVIATRAGGNADNVSPEAAVLLERGPGLVDALAEEMRALAGDTARREGMGKAGRLFMAGRGMDTYCRRLMDILGERG